MASPAEPGAKPAPKPPKKRTVYLLVGFFLFAGFGMLVAGAFAWRDEHSGAVGTAHIYQCIQHTSKYGGLNCDARWTVNGHTVTGYVENPAANQLGKDVSVRIHAHHVTETRNITPIGLWLMGLFVISVFGWLLVRTLRGSGPPPAARSQPGSASSST